MTLKPANPTGDPLIDEVRAVREAICAEFDNDVHKLAEHLRELEKQYEGRMITDLPYKPRKRDGAA